jgi:uncharacterized protein
MRVVAAAAAERDGWGARWLHQRPLFAFVAIAYGFTWLVMLPLLLQRFGHLPLAWPSEWEAVAAFGPLLAAWLVLRAAPAAAGRWGLAEFRAAFGRWSWGWTGTGLVLLAPLAFLAVAALVQAFVPAPSARLGAPGNDALQSARALAELLVISSIVQSLGEEPGWRGYLLPRLRERRGPLAATFVLFPLWLFWHVPMFLTRPELGAGQFAAFALGILSAALWATAIWESTQSIPAVIVWHAWINLLRGIALGLSTLAFLGFGLAVTIGAIAVAILLARRGPLRVAAARA